MSKLVSKRLAYLLGFLATSALLGLAAYLQIHDNLSPCPLCILQRIVLGALGIVFFLAAAFRYKRFFLALTGLAAILLSIAGILLAGRQVWLQHTPPIPGESCGASLQYMMKVLPLDEVLKNVFRGGSECSQIGQAVLGLSLAEWSLLGFIVFFFFSVWQLRRQ